MATTITFLGTSSVTPAAQHDTACFIINRRFLVDTGWNAAINMLQYGISPLDVEYLLFTHCHHDHYIGLPQLLFYVMMRKRDKPDQPPLKIIGPASDVRKVVELATNLLQVERFPELSHPPEIFPLVPGESFECEAFTLDTVKSLHPVEGMAYKFTDRKTGAAFAFTGDTAFHPPIADLARGLPLLIHEASYGAKRVSPEENRALHSSALDAAEIAQRASVERLALIHCAEPLQAEALAAARKIFPNTFFPEHGQIVEI
jgi:ribonuclease Z